MDTKKRILILSANPETTAKVRFDREVSEIKEGLRQSKNREQFQLEAEWAVGIGDFRKAMLEHEPNIVHFTGHGKKEGILLEGETGFPELVKTEALARFFELFKDTVECVLLSSCYSKPQANAIHRHISYVIGMKKEIHDNSAIKFSVGFYDALLSGRSVEDAFKLGRTTIDMHDLPESSVPVLFSPDKEPENIAIRSLEGYQNDVADEGKVDRMLTLLDRFENRRLAKGTWGDIKRKIREFIKETIKVGNRYNLYIPLHCSLAFFTGRELPPKFGAKISIYQPTQHHGRQLWQVSEDGIEKSEFDSWTVEEPETFNTGTQLAAAISVSRSVLSHVKDYVHSQLPGVSHLLHLELPGIGTDSIKSADHAYSLAFQAVEIIRDKCRQRNVTGMHLFIAAPNGFTFYLGQHAVMMGNLTMYEYDRNSGYSVSIRMD